MPNCLFREHSVSTLLCGHPNVCLRLTCCNQIHTCHGNFIVILAPALKIFNKIVITPWRYAPVDTKHVFTNKLVFLTLTNLSSKPLSLRDCLFREHRVSTLLCGLPPDVCLGLVCKGLPQSNSHLPSLCYCSFLKNLQQNGTESTVNKSLGGSTYPG